MIPNFVLSSAPETLFGIDQFDTLSQMINRFGKNVILVIGGNSLKSNNYYQKTLDILESNDCNFQIHHIGSEPSPSMVDDIVSQARALRPDWVLAIGGGSVLDGGKAISAMIPVMGSVKDYLEGVGTLLHPGHKIPLVAIPTTSGTGSEATKNAVLAEVGPQGFKKSLRHANFIPNVAILDPNLSLDCPKHVTAYSGMDAFSQLLESFLATKTHPIIDPLALQGLKYVKNSLLTAVNEGDQIEARAEMSLAAYISGLSLANAGLGLVHGIAGPMGGLHPIAHGLACSRLMYACNQKTIAKLRDRGDDHWALSKYAQAGEVFSGKSHKDNQYHIDALLDYIAKLTNELPIPSLPSQGLRPEDLDNIAKASENKNNPIKCTQQEILEILDQSMQL